MSRNSTNITNLATTTDNTNNEITTASGPSSANEIVGESTSQSDAPDGWDQDSNFSIGRYLPSTAAPVADELDNDSDADAIPYDNIGCAFRGYFDLDEHPQNNAVQDWLDNHVVPNYEPNNPDGKAAFEDFPFGIGNQ